MLHSESFGKQIIYTYAMKKEKQTFRVVTDLLITPEPEFNSECYNNKHELAEIIKGGMNCRGPNDI